MYNYKKIKCIHINFSKKTVITIPSIRSDTIFSNIGNRTSVVVNTVLPR